MRIEKCAHDCGDAWLWGHIGCFLVTPEVHRSLGGYVVSTPDCTWWVAVDDQDRTAGFCMARRYKNGKVVLTYAYILPELRGTGLYQDLFAARLNDVLTWPGVKLLEAAVNDRSKGIFVEHGFSEISRRGEFLVMQKELAWTK